MKRFFSIVYILLMYSHLLFSQCWQSISSGWNHSAGIKSDGTLWAWGRNDYGQLGNGTNIKTSYPEKIGLQNDWAKVYAIAGSTGVIKNNGSLWFFGDNIDGKFGNGTTTNSNIPIQSGVATNWSELSGGSGHIIALKTNGTLWGAGYNAFGQLGLGNTVDKTQFTQIGTGTNWQSMASGAHHTIAIKTDGSLWAWGYNSYGQIGDNTTTQRNSPVRIGLANDWAKVSCGSWCSFAIKSDGTLWAWGYNSMGQLGDGTTTQRNVPTQIGTATDWLNINAGSNFTIAIKSDSSLWSWGYNNVGNLGNGIINLSNPNPSLIATNNKWINTAAGDAHTIALTQDNVLYAWGLNYNGSLGIGENNDIFKATPTLVGNICNPYANVYKDLNSNCKKDTLEPNLNGITLSVQPGNLIYQSFVGRWNFSNLGLGTYTALVDTTGHWKPTCSPNLSFTITNVDSFYSIDSLGMVNVNPCIEPHISIFMPTIRPCFSNQMIYLRAQNLSDASQVMYNSYADIKLDPLLTIDSSTMPFSIIGNNLYRFQLDSIYPGQIKLWEISTTVSCNANLGQTICLDANIYPVSQCVLDSTPNVVNGTSPCLGPWDNSSLSIVGECIGDSMKFVIKNNGVLGNGNMNCFMPIRTYVNGQFYNLDSLKLLGGDSLIIMIPGDGKTWRLETDQHPFHPGNSHPNASVEACGDSLQVAQNWTPGLVNTMPLNDADPIIDIYCGQVSGSFDPNDKTGYPLGVTNNNFILPNQQLHYVIRFQNTGTDTAFTVVIRDTLDTDLDIFSVKPGVSSHNYTFRMYGPRVLEWTFNNIMLPDSVHSEPNSHGFVTFTVEQNENLPNGTLIENSAAIYFDFNDPIITNKSQHTIIETWPLITSVSDLNNIQQSDIQVYPNPTEDKLHVLSNLPSSIKLLDLTGRILQTLPNLKTSHELNLSEYPAGIYLLEVEVKGKIEVRKVIKR